MGSRLRTERTSYLSRILPVSIRKKLILGISTFLVSGALVGSTILPSPPDAVDDSASATADTITDIEVLINDSDPNGDSLTVINASDPANGTTSINADNTVRYIPDLGFTGSDDFAYTISDGTNESEIKLTASDAEIEDRFTVSLDVSGDVMAIAASTADAGTTFQGGVIYVFRRNGTSWLEEAMLSASDPDRNAQLGKDVAVDGDLIVAGAYKDNEAASKAGAAYVFRWNGVSWIEEAKLIASDAAQNDEFGRFVGISGETIVVGAWLDDDGGADSGSAYVFRRNGASWVEEAKLTASDASAGDAFARNVEISGGVIVAGAAEETNANGLEAGSAYVFRYNGSAWVEEQKLTASDGAPDDWFGRNVDIDGNRIVVGAMKDDDNGSASGSAYVFEWDGSNWTETNKLVANDGNGGDRFGTHVGVSGNLIVVGAAEDEDLGAGAGSAYVFQRNAANWIQHRKLTASDAAAGDTFGDRTAVHGSTVLVGAKNNDSSTGSAYVYPIGTDTATVNVTVDLGSSNNPPVLATIGDQTLNEGASLTVPLSATDGEGNGLGFSATGLPAFASLTDNGDGTGSLQLDPDFTDSGTYPVTVTVTDDGVPVLTDSEAFNIQVNNINQAPVLALIGDQAVPESGSVSVPLSATDPDGNGLGFSATGLPVFASLVDNGDGTGSLEINPTGPGDNSTYPVTVTVSDDGTPVLSDSEAISIVVGSTNQPPVLAAIGDQALDEGASLTVPLSATDPDGNGLSFSATGLPVFASLTDNGDGTGSLQLDPDFTHAGTYPMTVTVSDAGTPVLIDSEAFTISVNAVSGSGALSGSSVIAPASVDLAVVGAADWAHYGLAALELFTHKSGVTQQISDVTLLGGAGVDRYTATRSTYSWTNGTPTASVTNTDTGLRVFNVAEGFQVTLPADTTDRTVTVYVGVKKATGRLEATLSDGSAVPYEVFVDKVGGKKTEAITVNYRAASSAQTLTINYTMDTTYAPGNGTVSIESVTLMGPPPVNNPPVLATIGDQTLNEGASLTVPLSATDGEGNGLGFSATGLPAFASLTDNGDGTGSLQLDPDFTDSGTYPVTVTVTDDGVPVLTDSEAFNIQVNNINQAPVLALIGDQAVPESGSVSVPLSATDPDGNGLGFSATGLPVFASLVDNGDGTGSLEINPTGPGDNSTYPVTVTVSDDGTPVLSDSEAISIVVGSTNQPPVLAAIGDQALDEGASLTVPLSATDPDGNGLSFSATGLPVFASLTDNGDGTGSLQLDPDFTHAGTYPMTVTVSDAGTPVLIDSEAFTISVNAVSGSGALSGSSVIAPASVDLAVVGAADWAHYGLAALELFTHKSGVTQQISDVTLLGGAGVDRYTATRSTYSWTNGTPTASVTNTDTGLRVFNVAEGFQVTLPADTTDRTVTVYVGVKKATGRLEATLSDGSAVPYEVFVDKVGGKKTEAITVNYRAASSAQTLTINYTMDTTYAPGSSSVSLEGAALLGP